MKANVIKMIPLGVLAFGILSLQNCKKDAELSENPVQENNALATAKTSVSMPSYVVSTVGGRNPDYNFPKGDYPYNICSDADGVMYVTSPDINTIYKVTAQGSYTFFLNYEHPYGIKAGANGSVYFISSHPDYGTGNSSEVIVKADKNKKTTILPVTEPLSGVRDLAIGPDSSIYIPDPSNNRIIKRTKAGVTSILAGKKGTWGDKDGLGEQARFNNPGFVKFGADGNLWVVDDLRNFVTGIPSSIRKISMKGQVTTFFKWKNDVNDSIPDTHIICFAVTKRDKNFKLTPYENVILFVSTDRYKESYQLFHLSYDKVLTPLTGNLAIPVHEQYKDGPALQATFEAPRGLTVNPNGIFVAEAISGAIRKIARH
ncbi:hypothetical protein GS399_01290 [Pedobacter sp. HMF7647]|uniref:DUF839 domain-containing protein n=1 Tax=Hufsiella arboris TaxID=2695275 RepID=A0A7K1Y5E5_9SPHI|nr:hypothetical protein [Hufsiella arboris]MXV49591.1 hypothetical protein [Hufsiella arboris]